MRTKHESVTVTPLLNGVWLCLMIIPKDPFFPSNVIYDKSTLLYRVKHDLTFRWSKTIFWIRNFFKGFTFAFLQFWYSNWIALLCGEIFKILHVRWSNNVLTLVWTNCFPAYSEICINIRFSEYFYSNRSNQNYISFFDDFAKYFYLKIC